MRHSINFGGINSADFGIYISGEGVFDAPKRAVETVTVPGRNGDIIIDLGHYENITVEYPAYIVENSLGSFSSQLRAFRNALSSQVGYQRLTDTIHTDEYRMAAFIEGFETNVIKHNTAASISLKFNCKPQRWLTSGETSISVDSGDTLTNPTRYEASPVLTVNGYGTIGFNGYEIEIVNNPLGYYELPSRSIVSTGANTYQLDLSMFETGDTINVSVSHTDILTCTNGFPSSSQTYGSGVTNSNPAYTSQATAQVDAQKRLIINPTATLEFTVGTSATSTNEVTVNFIYRSGSITIHRTIKIMQTVTYTASGSTISESTAITSADSYYTGIAIASSDFTITGASGVSTKSLLGDVIVDCDLGECYQYDGDNIIDLNGYIDLGSDLPKLAPGANEITFDNTITSLKVTPGWWQL